MIGTVVDVVRGEGLASATRRAAERAAEAAVRGVRLVRGAFAQRPEPELVNVLTMPPVPRLGGVPVQLLARLAEERRLRDVALFHEGVLEMGGRVWRMQMPRARTVILEGGFTETPSIEGETILIVHDFSLYEAAPRLFPRARAVIFPSEFLCNAYRAVVPRFNAHVIEPGIADPGVRVSSAIRNRIALVGSVKPHKGGALYPAIIGAADAEWHVFGGGDRELLLAIRAIRGAHVHGYYRAGGLPHLLARHRIGLAVLPSVVPESFSLTLSECWSAGVPVVAFDQGAIAERIRIHGGGFLVSPEAGAAGIAHAVREWLRGSDVSVPPRVPTARDAAAAHVALYRALGVLR
jgi:glycosyltransferase involved in cell wall biosynthesis